MATLLLSQGVPMILAGDECRRTQQGNNNAWCQDNPISWFDWRLVEQEADMVRFVRELVALRRSNPTLRRRDFLVGGTSAAGSLPDVEWFSPDGVHIDWYAADGSLACFFGAPTAESGDGVPRHVIVFAHAGSAPKSFHVPRAEAVRGLPWRLFIDTSRPPPADIHPAGAGPLIDVEQPLELSDRALVCLLADAQPPVRRRIAGPRS